MSFTDDYLKLRKKREEEDAARLKNRTQTATKTQAKGTKKGTPTAAKTQAKGAKEGREWRELKETRKLYTGAAMQRLEQTNFAKTPLQMLEDGDIAPVITEGTATGKGLGGSSGGGFGGRSGREEEEEKERSWFRKGVFKDGYDFGDVTKTILGTVGDVTENVGAGAMEMGEKVVDAAAYLAPLFAKGQFYQNGGAYQPIQVQQDFNKSIDESKKGMSEFVAKDLYNSEELLKGVTKSILGVDYDDYSVLGEKSDALAQSGGQLLATAGLQAVGVPWFVTTGVTSFGAETENAFNEGAAYEEAGFSAAVTAGAEILTEKLSGGISFGGKTLDDALTKQIARGVSNKTVRTLAKLGLDMTGEGFEEVLSGAMSALGQKITYADDKELSELFSSEEALESFIGGAVLGGVSGGVNAFKSGVQGVDYASGLTKNEQAVVDKIYNDEIAKQEQDGKKLTQREKSKIYDEVLEDMEKGYISTDKIEEILGGETFKSYKDTVDNEDALSKEFEELGNKQNATLAEQSRYAELKQQLDELKTTSKRDSLKTQLSVEVFGLVQNDRLLESYNERGRRRQSFEADITQYDAKQQETVKRAVESGILNNTNRTHEFVDMIAKISADKGVLFDFTNNARLKESGFAVDGKSVNGYVTKDGVTLNIDSAKSLNRVVGHEITHVLEGTELYDALKQTVFEYAKSKGEYDSRLADLTEIYKSVQDADIDAELTADLVGDYLFSDGDFVKNLSVQHRNVFQKIYDEIKYLCKVATAGSKEARELERVKRAFEEAYREGGKQSGGTKYSVSDKNIKDVSTGYGYGETYFTMSYTQDGKVVGTLEYGEYDGEPNVKMVEVDPEYRRQGIGKKLLQELQMKYPDTEISFGMTTPDGTKLLDSITYDVTDEAVVADRQKLKDLQTELNDLQEKLDILYDTENLTEAQETELHKLGDRWTEVYDTIRELEQSLRGKRATKTYVKTDTKYSLSDSDGKQLTKEQQEYFKDSKMRDENGNLLKLYHGSPNKFTTFRQGTADGWGTGIYFTDNRAEAENYGENIVEAYLNITNPFDADNMSYYDIGAENTQAYIEYDKELWRNRYSEYETYEEYKADGMGADMHDIYEVDVETFNKILRELGYDGIIADGSNGIDGKEVVAFSENQAKLTTNEKPTVDADIRYSLTEYSAEEKEAHNKAVREHFGKTYKWAETGYILLDGSRLDLSGKHEGAPGGYRSVDHRDIVDALGSDYGDDTYSGSLVQFMSEGNIRISPESNGINLSVKPNKAQEQALSSFVSNARGEVLLDIDDLDGYTVVSVEYPRGTHANKVLSDIRGWFDNGTKPEAPNLFPFRSLSAKGESFAPTTRFDTFGRDIGRQDIAPVKAAPENAATQEAKPAREVVENPLPDDLFPIADDAERLASLTDADMPPEVEAPYYEDSEVTADDPFADRDIKEVGNRKVKAYMYENPEVKPFFQAEANVMLGELRDSTKGGKLYNDELYYATGGEQGWDGVQRETSNDIAYLLDETGYTYAQIEKGLKAIIEDDGAENNAISKRIEFILNDRLKDGYTDFRTGYDVPPNEDYINLLNEKQITEYNARTADSLVDTVPPAEEDIAPIKQTAKISEEIAPVKEKYEAITPKKEAQPRLARADNVETEKRRSPRQTLHNGIMDNIKARFAEKGLDFDKVLKKAKNLSTFATVDNIPQRVMEKALGYKEGQILSDITVNKVAQNETEGIKWLNSYTDRKSGLLAQISKQYNIKPGSKESAAAQMYAEGFYVNENNDIIQYGDNELAKDFPDSRVQANIKGLARDPRIRQIYDDTLAMINESRTRNAYPEIPRLDNYFLHFRAMEDTFSKLGLPFNPNDIRAKDLPTDLNGVTADLKPGQPFFASAMHRTGKRTSFDLLGGLEKYLTSAKNQIYHIDDIQTLRALRNYIADTYGQANGLDGLDELSEEEQQERIAQVYNSHLSTFAKFLNEEANILAGKTSLIDRGAEGMFGRRAMTFLKTVDRQVGANMVGYNISSSLTNFLPVAQTFAKTSKRDFVKAFGQTVANRVGSVFGRTDGFTENSPVAIRRKGAERFYRTPWQKMSDPGYALMSAVDNISTELIARTKYNELTRKGMDSQKAHYETDKWVSRLMGDRSLGQMPQIYNSKALGIITKFQLEVRNQLDSQFYDTIQEAKLSNEEIENRLERNAKTAAKVTSTLVQLAVVQHLFGKAFESVAGYNPAFDIIEVLMTACGFDDDEDSEDTALDNIEQGFFALMDDLPYTSVFTGGRIPIASALPFKELVKGVDEWGNEKSRWETLGEALPYHLLPGGYGQIKKTYQGLSMFDDDLPVAGSYTDGGNLRFPVEDTLKNRIQAGIFGQWANENARDYFDNNRSPLKEKQIEEFLDVDIPIQDYWEYREGLSGLDKLGEKADYIDSLDLPISKKNLLINNIADRKEPIDLTDYDKYADFEEFDFAIKNPEKYEIAEQVGGYKAYMEYQEDMKDMKLAEKAEYIANLDLTDEQKSALINGETDRKEPIDMTGYDTSVYSSFEEFEYAEDYPENYAVAKSVGGYEAYRSYSSELYDIKADKDENGKSISGSRKEKVADYISGLDIDDGMKYILFKNEYNADDTYNYEIIEYLNSREDISFEEEVIILKKLGFEVDSKGNITWD